MHDSTEAYAFYEAGGRMILAQQCHHVFRIGAFGKAGETTRVLEQDYNLAAVAFELLFRVRRDNQIRNLRRRDMPLPRA